MKYLDLLIGVGYSLPWVGLFWLYRTRRTACERVLQGSPIAKLLISTDGEIFEANQAAIDLLGYSPGGLTRLTLDAVTHPDDRTIDLESLQAVVAGKMEAYQQRKRLICKDGRVSHVSIAVAGIWAKRKLRHLVAQIIDLNQQKQLEDWLKYQAVHDALTCCYNRHYLNDLQPGTRYRGAVFIDLNWFRQINNSRGHLAGDRVLETVAARLLSLAGCEVIRDGGDEFLVLTNRDPKEVAWESLSLIQQPVLLFDREERLGAAIGFANGITDGSPYALRQASELAMRRAKLSKRSTNPEDWICEWSLELQRAEERRIEIISTLRQEIKDGTGLWLAYQPIVRIADKSRVGLEALARWENHTLGNVSPGEFIPIAESEGMIDLISEWVIDSAIDRLREKNDLYISINITPWELEEPRMAPKILGKLDAAGVEHRRLGIEVTERDLYQDIDRYAGSLAQLQGCQIVLSVDDFGTGSATFANLLEFPYFSRVKLDKRFLPLCELSASKMMEVVQCLQDQGLPQCQQLQICSEEIKRISFCYAVAGLTRSIGMGLIAEGVETEFQHEFLKTICCEYGQGYYYDRPMRWESL